MREADEDSHEDDCECEDCKAEREAAKDRQFDEEVALGYRGRV